MDSKDDIKLAFFLNLGFSLFELIGGLLTNSISIFSDAIHDFGDSLAIGIAYILEKISNKKSDKNYTYGYKRYSLLGASLTSIILIVGSLIVLGNAMLRLFNPMEVHFAGMFIFAIFGIAINGYAAYKTSKSVNMNEKSVNLHMLEDVLGWIAVLVGALLIKITGWNVIDPLLSIVIAILIGYEAIKNVLDVVNVILEKTPASVDIDLLKEEIKKIDHVLDVHHIHVWSLDGNEVLLTMHVLINKTVTKKNYELVKKDIKDALKSHSIQHSTIEIEYENCEELDCE